MPNQSEFARLREQIHAEYEAAQRGMTGLALGTSQHAFITARMEIMGEQIEALREVGGEEAVNSLLDTLGSEA